MFEPARKPRVFALAPGVDFPKALVDGLRAKQRSQPPDSMGRVQLIVNTTRMERRLRRLIDTGPPGVLPKLHLLTRLDMLDPSVIVPPAISPLRRRLELIDLVGRLLEQQKDLAPRASLYGLTDSLAALMDEMQGEGVTAQDIGKLEVSDQSGHWQRALAFIRIAQTFLDEVTTEPDTEARQRQLVAALIAQWDIRPPQHPVVLAGSTGSRGTTLMLMEAIAKLPQGALVLPGFDFDMPAAQWSHLDDQMLSEDHPQYRFHKLMRHLNLNRDDIQPWHDTAPPAPARNALISLALRPAPVTHAWRDEGPKLRDLGTATETIALVEAPNPRSEALAIALRLRKAVDDGQKAAVITPDRMLTRQISAALDQWGILPDDSAGTPLHLSPPGRFLRHVAGLMHRRLDAEALLTLLKHPLCHSSSDRGAHVLNTQRLELRIRDRGLPYPDAKGIAKLMADVVTAPEAQADIDAWATWVGTKFVNQQVFAALSLTDWVASHIALAEAIAAGPDSPDSGELWQKKAGREALALMENLRAEADHGGSMQASDYSSLVSALLSNGEVRDRDAPHPDVMIWGTLEARVQGADLVILAGLNDGIWPEAPSPDPWLNRDMRKKAGLLLPERRIGLSAHDFQQAVGASNVWITRSIRSEDAETVPSRWLNRLSNLLGGLEAQEGPDLLQAMRARGEVWTQKAVAFEAVRDGTPAKRPSPRPPATSRLQKLAVTDIKHLVRDPYAIYAKHVLRLRKLGPLVQSPDALARGIVLHEALETFVRRTLDDPDTLTASQFMDTARAVLDADVPWPAARALWLARFDRVAAWFVNSEAERQVSAVPIAFEDEARGRMVWSDLNFELVARADRIDRTDQDTIRIYDYKTGKVPTAKEQRAFDKQLLIEAAMVEGGSFKTLGSMSVEKAIFIGLGSDFGESAAPLDDMPPAKVLAELRQLIAAFQDVRQGFTSRQKMKKDSHSGDYDLLARFGEWDLTDDPVPEDLV